LGANIGTTITALLAATAVTGVNAIFALQIALIHFLYNLIGVIVIYGIPFLRGMPIKAAETLSVLAQKNKLYVAGYILLVFVIIPLILIGTSEL
jgi:sodium-dependent phosphate cotransporter